MKKALSWGAGALVDGPVDLILGYNPLKVGIIGLGIEPGIDDLRQSLVVQLVETLSGKGMDVRIYDEYVNLPKRVEGNKAYIERVLPHVFTPMCPSTEQVLNKSNVIVVAHDPRERRQQLIELLKPYQLLFDFVKVVSDEDDYPGKYEGICW